MTTSAFPGAAAESRLSFGPWLFGAKIDLGLFAGSALLALGLVAVGHLTGLSNGALPEWGFVVFVIAIDVAHVYSTLFRTYFDREELGRHRLRYSLVPVAAYAAGVALYFAGPLVFWRVLAYLALFHFVRQQVGWVAVYRARSGRHSRLDRLIDEAAVYSATLYPVIVWHARLAQTRFAWFVQGDFVDFGRAAQTLVPYAKTVWMVALGAFFVQRLVVAATRGVVELGKLIVVVTTAASWYVGIVVTNSDFDFTVTNVIVHGTPYVALLFVYAQKRRREAPALVGSQIIAGGLGAFVVVLVLFAFVEELAWDRLVWRERPWLFGSSSIELAPVALALIVPLLALPQTTHYVLDGLLWRRKDTQTRPAQRAALGFSVSFRAEQSSMPATSA